jgi:hypothetical protein
MKRMDCIYVDKAKRNLKQSNVTLSQALLCIFSILRSAVALKQRS